MENVVKELGRICVFERESAIVIWVTIIAFMLGLIIYLPKCNNTIVLFVCVLIAALAGVITCRYCNTRLK